MSRCLPLLSIVLIFATGTSAMTLKEYRALPDDKIAVRTSYGVRSARSTGDTTIKVVIGLSVTPMCERPGAWRIVSFEDERYAFEAFVNPVEAAVRTELEMHGTAGCPFERFERTVVTLSAPEPLREDTRYHAVAIGQDSQMVTAAHSAASFVHGRRATADEGTWHSAVLGMRRILPAGPRHLAVHFGPNFAAAAGDKPENYAVSVNGEPVGAVRAGRFTRVDTYLPVGWPFRAIPEHIVFLELPSRLQEGDRIRVTAGPSVTTALAEAELHFTAAGSLTDSVKVNQVGYLTDSPAKWAYLGRWMGSLGALRFEPPPDEFQVCRADSGQVAWRGRPELRHVAGEQDEGVYDQDFSGEDVYVLDFTAFREPGDYFISVPGVGRSFEFRIAGDVYADAFGAAAHGVFIQRCGIALGPPYSDWRRIACHKDGITRTTAPNLGHEQHWKDLPEYVDPERPLIQAFGGHHDAGDYNPRSHIDVAQVLMDAYEMAPGRFADGQLNIPEAGNGIPDIIDEADWALQLWIMLQDDDGGVPHGTESNGDPNFIQTAELDPLGDYAYARDAEASFTFAGTAAQAARIRRAMGRDAEAADLLARALDAYDWALAHDHSRQGARDAWAYAAAQMLQTRREPVYAGHFAQACVWTADLDAPLDRYREYDQSRAAWAYVNCPPSLADNSLREAVRRAILRQADEFVTNAETMGYAFIKHPYAPINWGTGGYENFLYPVIWASQLTGEERYRQWMVHTCDNTLGANPLNLSWIVDLGTKTIRAPLHNSRYGTSGEAAPGLQAQGPNQNAEGYRVRESFHPSVDAGLPPLYSFVDCHFAIAMDEGTVRSQANTMAAFGLLLPGGH